MDQRYSSHRSPGIATRETGWKTFKDDQLALLDHLGIAKCHLFGSCIGPSYILNLLQEAPERFGKCVLQQPIGLTHHTGEPNHQWEGLNRDTAWTWVGDWAQERLDTAASASAKQQKDYTNGGETMEILRHVHGNMFLNGRDFVFSITRDQASEIQTPMLVFMGHDICHPSETAREIAKLCPNAELVEEWRDVGPEKLAQASKKIHAFLSEPP